MGFFQRLKSSKNKRSQFRRRLLLEPLETRTLMALDLAAIGGTAFVDLTGNGLTPDDTRSTASTVELYRDNGDNTFNSATDTLLGTTTTNASGVYRFASTNAGGTAASQHARRPTTTSCGSCPSPASRHPPPRLVTVTAANVNGTTVQTVDTFDTTEQAVTANTGTPTCQQFRCRHGGDRWRARCAW